VAVFALSAGVLILGIQRREFPYFYGIVTERSVRDFAALAGVCIFGFALCPYLDRTFLHARQRTSTIGARAAFAAGFAVFFLIMIVLTLSYTGWMNRLLWGSSVFPEYVWRLVGLHLLVQSMYTVTLHW